MSVVASRIVGPTKLPFGYPSTLTPRPSRRILPPWSVHVWMSFSTRSLAAGVMSGPLRAGSRNTISLYHPKRSRRRESERNERDAHLGVRVEPVADLEPLRALDELVDPLLRVADGDERRERHAALPGGAERRADDRVERKVAVGVGHEDAVVCEGEHVASASSLGHPPRGESRNAAKANRPDRARARGRRTLGAEVGLDALAVLAARLVDVLAGAVAADERDGLDARLLADELDRRDRAVDDVQDALGETCGRAQESQLPACTLLHVSLA